MWWQVSEFPSFLWLNSSPLRDWGCLCLLATVNVAAADIGDKNILMPLFSALLGVYPGLSLLGGRMVTVQFCEEPPSVFTAAAPCCTVAPPVAVNGLYWSPAGLIHLPTACGCFELRWPGCWLLQTLGGQ